MHVERHQLRLLDIRAVDGDTLQTWLDYHDQVRVKVRIRLPGIEGGELGTVEGVRAKATLERILTDYKGRDARLATAPTHKDNHGRIVSDIIFDDGQTLAALLLRSGNYWHRGRATPPGPTPPTP